MIYALSENIPSARNSSSMTMEKYSMMADINCLPTASQHASGWRISSTKAMLTGENSSQYLIRLIIRLSFLLSLTDWVWCIIILMVRCSRTLYQKKNSIISSPWSRENKSVTPWFSQTYTRKDFRNSNLLWKRNKISNRASSKKTVMRSWIIHGWISNAMAISCLQNHFSDGGHWEIHFL